MIVPLTLISSYKKKGSHLQSVTRVRIDTDLSVIQPAGSKRNSEMSIDSTRVCSDKVGGKHVKGMQPKTG